MPESSMQVTSYQSLEAPNPQSLIPSHLSPLSNFGVQGSGFRVQGSGFKVQGSGFKVRRIKIRSAAKYKYGDARKSLDSRFPVLNFPNIVRLTANDKDFSLRSK